VSTREETLRQACGPDGKDTRSGRQPLQGNATRFPRRLSEETLARLRSPGPRRPRGARPGQRWTPATPAEQLLVEEASRWHRVSQTLLDELGRVRLELTGALAQLRPSQLASGVCPLTEGELRALTAAAAGEPVADTARRLRCSKAALQQARKQATKRLSARNPMHAVALATAAGWIRRDQLVKGENDE
jgi:DNA-binding CsgD family transcriptional regulator